MYDFIIVGAGASGCTLAWRLASLPEQPQVLLIEAGDVNDELTQRIDGDRWISRMNKTQNWGYKTEPQEGLDGMVIDYDRGKGLGGSTAINFCCYTVGPAGDYDRLSRIVGDEDFSWRKASEVFRQLETFHFESDKLPGSASKYVKPNMKIRGHQGPLNVGFAREWEQAVTNMIDICDQAGLNINHDMNSGNPIGVGVTPQTATNGLRSTAADLLPHVYSNLTVSTNQQVWKLTFDGNRCTGVQTDKETIYAKKEVILCCGSLDSPKILLHSGIGPTNQLNNFGIDTLIDLPGVGSNLRDHHHIFITWERADHTTQRKSFYQSAEQQTKAHQQWLDDRTGPLSDIGTTLAMGWLKSQEITESAEFAALAPDQQNHLIDPTVPHFELAFNPATADYFINPQAAPALLTAGVFVLNPESRGICELQSADPAVPLKFDPKFFSHPYDRRVAVEATRSLLKLAEQPQFAQDTIKVWSGPASDREEDILAFWKKATMSTWHMSGTVAMGIAGAAETCVDSDFQVVGIKGLRVADMSVVPIIMNCHVQSVAYCMGFIAADKIARQYYATNRV